MKPKKKIVTVGEILDMVRKGKIDLNEKIEISLGQIKKDAAGRHQNKRH